AGAEECLDRSLAGLGVGPDVDLDRASALVDRGRVRRLQGKRDLAEKDFESALALATHRGLLLQRLGALDGLARIAKERGELQLARTRIDVAVNGFRELDEQDYLLDSLLAQAEIELAAKDRDRARAIVAEADRLLARPDVLGAYASAAVRSRYVDWGRFAQELAFANVDAADKTTRPQELAIGLEQADHWRGRALLSVIAARSPAAVPPPESR